MQLQRLHQMPALHNGLVCCPSKAQQGVRAGSSASGAGWGRRLGSGHCILGRLSSVDLRRSLHRIIVKHEVVLPHLQHAFSVSTTTACPRNLTKKILVLEHARQASLGLGCFLKLAGMQAVKLVAMPVTCVQGHDKSQ